MTSSPTSLRWRSDAVSGSGVTSTVTVIDNRPAVELDTDAPLVRAVWDAHAEVAATPPRLGGVPGTTDGTLLTALAGVPSVVYGPGGKWIAHQADEYVDVADIVEHANVYVEAARRFLDGDACTATVRASERQRGSARRPAWPGTQ